MTHSVKKYVCLSEVERTVQAFKYDDLVRGANGRESWDFKHEKTEALSRRRGEILKFSSMKKFPTSENFVILLFLENFELVCSTTNTSTYHYSRNLAHFNTPNQFYRPIYPVSIELMCRLTYAISYLSFSKKK